MSVEETEREGLFTEQTVSLPADDTMQWRAALMQLVNWGGFGGLTTVPLRGEATMISGASGVGKSTILDAYTALMMPSDTKFNGASNDAVAGRARGVGQRNLLSYLRGAVDVVDDPRTGRPVEKLLRGKGDEHVTPDEQVTPDMVQIVTDERRNDGTKERRKGGQKNRFFKCFPFFLGVYYVFQRPAKDLYGFQISV